MHVSIIHENKKDFLELLLLADEEERMIDKYLERGTLFALYDGDLKSICVVTDEKDSAFEIQSIATDPRFWRKGYGSFLLSHVCDFYKGKGATMLVGTGDCPWILSFYQGCGFVLSHRIADYFTTHYAEAIYEDGILLKDKVYLKKQL